MYSWKKKFYSERNDYGGSGGYVIRTGHQSVQMKVLSVVLSALMVLTLPCSPLLAKGASATSTSTDKSYSHSDDYKTLTITGNSDITPKAVEEALSEKKTSNSSDADTTKTTTTSRKDDVTSIIIKGSIKSIAANSFSGMKNLEKVDIQSTANTFTIGDSAFSGCENLSDVTLSSKTTTIYDSAFEGCEALETINIPETVKSIGSSAFSGTGLTEINLPTNIDTIKSNTFQDCAKLKKVSLPKGIKTVESNAFNGCTNLVQVWIPASIEKIEQGAFKTGNTGTNIIFCCDNASSDSNDTATHADTLVNVNVYATWTDTNPKNITKAYKTTISAKTVDTTNEEKYIDEIGGSVSFDDADKKEDSSLSGVTKTEQTDSTTKFKYEEKYEYAAANTDTEVVCTAMAHENYEFVGWYNSEGEKIGSGSNAWVVEETDAPTVAAASDSTPTTSAGSQKQYKLHIKVNATDKISYEARFKPITYTLKFDLTGSDIDSADKEVITWSGERAGKAISKPLPDASAEDFANAKRTGYVFAGWTPAPAAGNSSSETVIYEAGKTPSTLYSSYADENRVVTLKSSWEPLQYNMTFDANHNKNHVGYTGMTPGDNSEFNYSSEQNEQDKISVTTSKAFNCTCSEFLGWSLVQDGTADDVIFTVDDRDSKTYTSKYSGKELYEILSQKGLLSSSDSSNADGIDITLYGTWGKKTYTVNFDQTPPKEAGSAVSVKKVTEYDKTSKGNTTKDYTMSLEYDDTSGKLIPADILTCDGYKVTGWKSVKGNATLFDKTFKADGTSYITGEDAAKICAAQSSSDYAITLYPIWEKAYTIELKSAVKDSIDETDDYIEGSTGGEVSISDKSGNSIDGSTIAVAEDAKLSDSYSISVKPAAGYEFAGWKMIKDGSLDNEFIAQKEDLSDFDFSKYNSEEPIQLAACFKKTEYTVTIKAGANSKIEISKSGFDGSESKGTSDETSKDSAEQTKSESKDTDKTVTASAESDIIVCNAGETRSVTYYVGENVYVRISELNAETYPMESFTISEISGSETTVKKNYSSDSMKGSKGVTEGSGNVYTINLADALNMEQLTGSYDLSVSCQADPVRKTFKITTDCGEHGTVSKSTDTAYVGDTVNVTVTPDSGYYISSLKVTTGGVSTDKTPKDYTSNGVVVPCTADTNIVAKFAVIPALYTVKTAVTEVTNGTFELSRSGQVAAGDSVKVTASPNSGYRVKAIYVNSKMVSRIAPYTFTVTADSEVYVTFEKGDTLYAITGEAGENGTISVEEELVEKGDDLTVTIKPNKGYKISKLYVDGKSVTAAYSYTFTNVKANHTIRATFTSGTEKYTIKGSAGTGGSVSIGTETVNYGDDLAVTITANSGYRINDVIVDGKSVGSVKEYIFENVDADHTLSASFVTADFQTSGQYGMVNEGGTTVSPTTYTDVTTSNWYYQSVKYAVGRGLMNSTSKSTFSPNQASTRADLVYMLYQNEDAPAVSTSTRSVSFDDVSSSSWYSNAINWAAQNGVVSGKTSSTFDPNGSITREQLATILYRYSANNGKSVSNTSDYLVRNYADSNAISSYAKDAVCWACNNGLITGKSSTKLDPKGTATRAELCTIVMRYCNTM